MSILVKQDHNFPAFRQHTKWGSLQIPENPQSCLFQGWLINPTTNRKANIQTSVEQSVSIISSGFCSKIAFFGWPLAQIPFQEITDDAPKRYIGCPNNAVIKQSQNQPRNHLVCPWKLLQPCLEAFGLWSSHNRSLSSRQNYHEHSLKRR